MAFAVIDFETTGLTPEHSDRVVEVGLVLVDSGGCIEREWSTLVNPGRDVGATRIHGLKAGDLLDAPQFSAISDEVLELVAGRVVVAHNASFDMRFMRSELERAGYRINDRPAALCSMKWSGRLVGPAKLAHVCDALGIALSDAHSALGDARATALLLSHLMRSADRNHGAAWREDIEIARRFAWPRQRAQARVPLMRRGEHVYEPDAWLNIILNATWVPGVPENEASYMLALERALLDRAISQTEARELVHAASGLSAVTISRLHRNYLAAMAQEALSDGVVTHDERADLQRVAETLGLTAEDVGTALESAAAVGSKPAGTFALAPGDRVVFTGEMTRSRDEWVATIVDAGLVSGGVTKSTKVVVAEDPDSMSGKAAKARQLGIPIIGEQAFVRLFEDYCAKR